MQMAKRIAHVKGWVADEQWTTQYTAAYLIAIDLEKRHFDMLFNVIIDIIFFLLWGIADVVICLLIIWLGTK